MPLELPDDAVRVIAHASSPVLARDAGFVAAVAADPELAKAVAAIKEQQEEFLTFPEAAALLKLSARTLQTKVNVDRLFTKITALGHGEPRLLRSEIEAVLLKSAVKRAGGADLKLVKRAA